jgi:hypothetical protein
VVGTLELTAANKRRLCLHEASHIACAVLLDRPAVAASVNGDGGASLVGTTKAGPISLEDALNDILLLTIGDAATVDARFYLVDDDEESDESRALSVAMRCAGSAREANAIVRLGKERARTMCAHPTFIRLTEAFAAELMHGGSLDAETIDHIREDVTNGNSKQAG